MVLLYNCSLPCNYALHSTILLKSHVDFIILSLLIKIDTGCRQFFYFILDICYYISKLSIFFGEFIVEIALAQKYRKKNLKTINKNHMRLFWIYLEFHIWIYFIFEFFTYSAKRGSFFLLYDHYHWMHAQFPR